MDKFETMQTYINDWYQTHKKLHKNMQEMIQLNSKLTSTMTILNNANSNSDSSANINDVYKNNEIAILMDNIQDKKHDIKSMIDDYYESCVDITELDISDICTKPTDEDMNSEILMKNIKTDMGIGYEFLMDIIGNIKQQTCLDMSIAEQLMHSRHSHTHEENVTLLACIEYSPYCNTSSVSSTNGSKYKNNIELLLHI